MKRLFIALTLLLMSFLSALDNLEGLHAMAARAGLHRWLPQLALAVLAALAVGVFVHLSRLHRRLLHPRRGARLLAVGLVVYAVGVAAATGMLVDGARLLAAEAGSQGSALPEMVARLYPQPVLVAALLLLVVGAFRALSNLVSPAEFEADF